jgi:hypothetical protein
LARIVKELALVGLVLAIGASVAAWTQEQRLADAWTASLLGAAIVWLSAAASLPWATRGTRRDASAAGRQLGAMLIRMTLPLAALFVATYARQHPHTGGWLDGLPPSLGGFLVLHYLLGLAVEIPLILASVHRFPAATEGHSPTT